MSYLNKLRTHILFTVIAVFLMPLMAKAEGPVVERFVPEGEAKSVRQVQARFSEQMVSFGDPRTEDPFIITCPARGKGRWADGENWVYDFDKELPAGMACSFELRPELKALEGDRVGGTRFFAFNTGGPAVLSTYPGEGAYSTIDEEQAFLLYLEAEAREEDVLSRAYCSVEGLAEKIEVRLITGQAREDVLKSLANRYNSFASKPVVLLQCKRVLPSDAKVSLVWGKGIRAASSDMPTTVDQVFSFKTRERFSAKVSCERVNDEEGCIPFAEIYVGFTAPVPLELASRVRLKVGGKLREPAKQNVSGGEGEEVQELLGEATLQSVSFPGPFEENASLVVEMPREMKDEAGRPLSNLDKFPLEIKTGTMPPLVKFPARFGILEAEEPVLPVTVRNIEPYLKYRVFNAEKDRGLLDKAIDLAGEKGVKVKDSIKGKVKYVEADVEVIKWLNIVSRAGRASSVFGSSLKSVRELSMPKPKGPAAFEVAGLELGKPGFYVVEVESRVLGQALLELGRPMYVPTSALVTNMSAHFKWGKLSSLVWVTSLDKGEPVSGAEVVIRDCAGTALWKGKTDKQGLARVPGESLPLEPQYCTAGMKDENYDYSQSAALEGINGGLFVFARKDKDFTFLHSSWKQGIEPWRFNLYGDWGDVEGVIAHTVFDRKLLRAGETVHMKHFVRVKDMQGFGGGPLAQERLYKALYISHEGSDQFYELPLKWNAANGTAETEWQIPKDAKLGQYSVVLAKEAKGDRYQSGSKHSGEFRVEEFRVPLMKGTIGVPGITLINAPSLELDLNVSYLSGGGATGADVRLRTSVMPRGVSYEEYDAYTFATGRLTEGRVASGHYYSEGDRGASLSDTSRMTTRDLTLGPGGSARVTISNLPSLANPSALVAEMEYRDPNGEVQTAERRVELWPSSVVLGLKTDSWVSSPEEMKFHVLALDTTGKPVPGVEVSVDIYKRLSFSHRKRLLGGLYSYEHRAEMKKLLNAACTGKTDEKGLLLCSIKAPSSGNLYIQALAQDGAGNPSAVNMSTWVRGKDEWWFEASDSDRMDLLPEKKRYEPGEKMKLQIRMPFRAATALITVEREGVMDVYVRQVKGIEPVVEIPVKPNYAPNVFISVLCVRGRTGAYKHTSMLDLAKPAYKLGIAEVMVGWKAYELKVSVSADKQVYKIRERAKVKVSVQRADGQPKLPEGAEVVVAAVDEGLLELMPNDSWKLLEAMMGRRGYAVDTATAQMQVVGKRHFGLKSLPQGGGGGKGLTREMFETLLLWKGRVQLAPDGTAEVEVPLQDSLTSYKVVAVASAGLSLFGTGSTSLRTTQDIMLFSGLPQVVRQGDVFRATFTVRNASEREMDITVSARIGMAGLDISRDMDSQGLKLKPGEAQEVGWNLTVPLDVTRLDWTVNAAETTGAASADRMKVSEKVIEALPVRVYQATLRQMDERVKVEVERPAEALVGRGGIKAIFKAKLSEQLGGIREYMTAYPYTCMEQKVSRAVALRDESLWKAAMAELPAYLDPEGMVKYFPMMETGSDVLTSYLMSVSGEAGWEVPEGLRERMLAALQGFVRGSLVRRSALPTADLTLRKLSALEALSRYERVEPGMLDSLRLTPNLWPTSAVIDWLQILTKAPALPEAEARKKEAVRVILSRANYQGTRLTFSTEANDNSFWWLMASADVNAVRAVIALTDAGLERKDIPKFLTGALGRQKHGRWSTTLANAWGVLAMEKFSAVFEAEPVTGTSIAAVDKVSKVFSWSESPQGGSLLFNWPEGRGTVKVAHEGSGKPWLSLESSAALPLKEPLSSGYRVTKRYEPVEQREAGKWSRGDVLRVVIDVEAASDMTWVVIEDPVPAGASLLAHWKSKWVGEGGVGEGGVPGFYYNYYGEPAFVERKFEALRAYYEFLPRGKWRLEYQIRLNDNGMYVMPPTRAEAMYAPEIMGEEPNATFFIGQ